MQACSPNHGADADCLEQIQRLVTRLVKGFRHLRVGRAYIAFMQTLQPQTKYPLETWILTPMRLDLRGHPFKVCLGETWYLSRSISFFESLSFGKGSQSLSLPPLPSAHSSTSKIQRGIIYFLNSYDLLHPLLFPNNAIPSLDYSHLRYVTSTSHQFRLHGHLVA